MARTQSSDVTAKLCQLATANDSASSPNIACRDSVIDTAMLPAQWVWTLRALSLCQIAALTHVWPSSGNAPTTILLIASVAILLGVSTLIRPAKTDAPLQSATTNFLDHHLADHSTGPTTTICQPAQHPPRRNKPAVRAMVAPLSAPNAVLQKDLDPVELVWADLMARMSHDLRTPLNAVIGFSDLMQREAFGPLGSPRYQEYARHIQDCGAALLKSTEDTLAMTSAMTGKTGDEPKHKPVSIESLANEAWRALSQKAATRCVSLKLSIDTDLEVHCDSISMRQVFLNLMEEALAHAPPNGQIVVKTLACENTVSIEIGTDTLIATRPSDTLPMCIARTLLHLHNAKPIIFRNEATGWNAVTVLERATQKDFFQTNTRTAVPVFQTADREPCAA